MNQNTLIIHCSGAVDFQSLALLLKVDNKKPIYISQSEHLDIDTPKKDSYELFEAGLDFAMVVTEKHHYLKSRHDVTAYLPIPRGTDWVIQNEEVYPADVRLTISDDKIFTESGEVFSLTNLSPLVAWLEAFHEQKNKLS